MRDILTISFERDDAVDPQVSVVDDGLKDFESLGERRGKRRRVSNTQYNDFWQH